LDLIGKSDISVNIIQHKADNWEWRCKCEWKNNPVQLISNFAQY